MFIVSAIPRIPEKFRKSDGHQWRILEMQGEDGR
jgi:hypothetical protein